MKKPGYGIALVCVLLMIGCTGKVSEPPPVTQAAATATRRPSALGDLGPDG